MSFIQKPLLDQWYRHRDKGEDFRVVAIDDDAGTVEIQHFDGDIEELDFADWHVTPVEPIPPPEDWTGPMDDVERDDLGYTDDGMEEQERMEEQEPSGSVVEEIDDEFESGNDVEELLENEDA